MDFSRYQFILDAMQSEQRYIFKPLFEKIYLILLAAFIIFFVVGHLFFGLPNEVLPVYKFIVAFLMLNIVHTIFTVLIFFFLPEARTWFSEKVKTGWVYYFSSVIIIILLSAYLLPYKISMSHKMEILISLLLGLYSSIHAVSQIKGISLVYNKISWPFLSDSERQAQAQLEKNERLLFNLFINLTIGYFIANELFKKFIEANHILYLFTGVQVLLFTLIAFNSFKYPQIQKTNKRFYLLSLVFPILFSYSPVAWALQRSLHGLEYSFLTYNIVSNSKTKISMAMKWLVGGVFTVILALVMLNWFQVNANVEFGSSGVIVPLIAFAFLLEYFHYYLDSQIFKFQGPSGRHLGSLLIPKR